MSRSDVRFMVCSCEDTMPLDDTALARALGDAPVSRHRHLCRSQIESFAKAAGEPGRLIVACTQEAPVFRETAAVNEAKADLRFTNIREAAGWSEEGTRAAAKMAALLAEATVEPVPTAALPVRSDGRALVWGEPEVALAAARQLAGRLAVTCVLDGFGDALPPAVADVALFAGRPAGAEGHVGAFTVTFRDVDTPRPASRAHLEPAARRDSAAFEADVILDVSRRPALFPGRPPRDGYVRADPGDPVAVQKALFEVADMVGEFEKPRYVVVNTSICAHSRNSITGCTKCLDACPTAALTPAGDAVAVDALACGGHGACNSLCPTGAIEYQVPRARDQFERLRVLLGTYAKAGGKRPVLLVHDGRGQEAIDLLARHGRGLPANVLPFAVNELGSAGLDRIAMVTVTDPDVLAEAVARQPEPGPPHSGKLVMGGRREAFALALEHLHESAPAPVDVLPLPEGAPFGTVNVDVDGCTLCLACVGACPTAALSDNPERPQLTFAEDACVQCGLCVSTCPEKVVSLTPRIAFTEKERRVLKEEEPFACIACGKEFAARSAIDRMVEKLSGHAAFAGEGVKLLQMCGDCRVIAQVKASGGHALAPAPVTRTSDDYLRARNGGSDGNGKGAGRS